MNRHTCQQITTLAEHKTELSLLKQMSDVYDKELDYIKDKLDSNNKLLITSLIGVILSLLGIIAGFFIDKI